MRYVKQFQISFAMLFFALVVGCSTVGSVTPGTFNEKLAVGIAAVTEVRATATTLLQAGKISIDDAKNVQASADAAREALNVARGLSGTDMTAATGKLDAANAALKAIQAYLLTKQGH